MYDLNIKKIFNLKGKKKMEKFSEKFRKLNKFYGKIGWGRSRAAKLYKGTGFSGTGTGFSGTGTGFS
jgi:hypothetical protein